MFISLGRKPQRRKRTTEVTEIGEKEEKILIEFV